jgi:hypothetical protein
MTPQEIADRLNEFAIALENATELEFATNELGVSNPVILREAAECIEHLLKALQYVHLSLAKIRHGY